MAWFVWVLLGVLLIAGIVIVAARRVPRQPDPLRPIDDFLAVLEQQRAEASVAVNRILTAARTIEEPLRARQEESRVWEERARAAVAAGNDEEARAHLRRQISAEQQAARLTAELQELSGTREQVEQQYALIRSRLEEAQRQREVLRARGAAAAVGLRAVAWDEEAAREREAFSALREQVQTAEAHAEAAAEVSALSRGVSAPSERELEERLLSLHTGRPAG